MASTPAEHAAVCPKCGHCPTCGRSNQPQGFYPYWPYGQYPYYWPYTYQPPLTTWADTTGPAVTTATINTTGNPLVLTN